MEIEKFGVVEMTAQEQTDENGGFLLLLNAVVNAALVTGIVVSLASTISDGYKDGYTDTKK